MAVSRDITVRIIYGDVMVEVTAEGVSWSPDVADDLIKRVNGLWKSTLESMHETDSWNVDALTDED